MVFCLFRRREVLIDADVRPIAMYPQVRGHRKDRHRKIPRQPRFTQHAQREKMCRNNGIRFVRLDFRKESRDIPTSELFDDEVGHSRVAFIAVRVPPNPGRMLHNPLLKPTRLFSETRPLFLKIILTDFEALPFQFFL